MTEEAIPDIEAGIPDVEEVKPQVPIPQKRETKKRIDLPQDSEARLSVLFHAAGLHLHQKVVELSYKDEVSSQNIRALTRLPRHVEKAVDERMAAYIHTYGPLNNLAIRKYTTRIPNYLLAGTVLFSTLAVLSYFAYYPSAQQGFATWWVFYGNYAVVGLFIGLAIISVVLLRRRKRRKVAS